MNPESYTMNPTLQECHVMSIGSNNDWSFERAMHALNPRFIPRQTL